MEMTYHAKLCGKCGKRIIGNEYEVEVYEDETPESVLKCVKTICESCYEELELLWLGF